MTLSLLDTCHHPLPIICESCISWGIPPRIGMLTTIRVPLLSDDNGVLIVCHGTPAPAPYMIFTCCRRLSNLVIAFWPFPLSRPVLRALLSSLLIYYDGMMAFSYHRNGITPYCLPIKYPPCLQLTDKWTLPAITTSSFHRQNQMPSCLHKAIMQFGHFNWVSDISNFPDEEIYNGRQCIWFSWTLAWSPSGQTTGNLPAS